MTRSSRWRTRVFLATTLLAVAGALGYALFVRQQRQVGASPEASATTGAPGVDTDLAAPAAPPAEHQTESGSGTEIGAPVTSGATTAAKAVRAAVDPSPSLLFIRANAIGQDYGKLAVARLEEPDERTYSATLTCERVHYARGRGVCLRANRGVFTTYAAVAFDRDLRPGWSLPLNGAPSRVRLSPSGALAAITVFLSGHSYASLDLSTETTIVDAVRGEVITDLEKFSITRNGAAFQSADFNFWGVTFAKEENRFYATLWTNGKTHLIEADVSQRTGRVVREGVECPSLSPDNSRIAFKHRTGPITWNLHVLDLRTMVEVTLGETRSVDDQVEWLDNDTLVYALSDMPGGSSPSTDLWLVSAQPGGTPRLLTRGAYSPAVTR